MTSFSFNLFHGAPLRAQMVFDATPPADTVIFQSVHAHQDFGPSEFLAGRTFRRCKCNTPGSPLPAVPHFIACHADAPTRVVWFRAPSFLNTLLALRGLQCDD
jgi:hypothetical protein